MFALSAFALLAAVSGAAAGVLVSIDKGSQRMTVTVDGMPKYVWPVSTGATGYTTPSGSYTPFRMEKDHFSEEWDDAPMPNSIFFTPKGHAIHGSLATGRLGTRASHGCVRLAPKNAEILYDLIEKRGLGNTRIVIADHITPPTLVAQSTPQLKFGKGKFVRPFFMDN